MASSLRQERPGSPTPFPTTLDAILSYRACGIVWATAPFQPLQMVIEKMLCPAHVVTLKAHIGVPLGSLNEQDHSGQQNLKNPFIWYREKILLWRYPKTA
jgi:hypothetical protein